MITPNHQVYYTKGVNYQIVDLGNAYSTAGINDDVESYARVKVIVPLKRPPQKSILIHVDGTELSDHCQLVVSGIVVPEWVAERSGLEHAKYRPKKRMTLHL